MKVNMIDNVVQDKASLRSVMLQMRETLAPNRRKEAQITANLVLQQFCEGYNYVLSYASFGSELDIWRLNHQLAVEKRLLLPKVCGDELRLFIVDDFSKQLLKSTWGIFEPNPLFCKEFELLEIPLILVPGLAFDARNHRLGFGKGYYDRLLCSKCYSKAIGIGFSEQLIDFLPNSETDVALSDVKFF